MGELRRRPADAEDQQLVYDITREASRDLVVRQFGRWDEAFQSEHFRKRWRPGRHSILIFKGTVVGCLAIEFHPQCLFLAELQIKPEYQNRGFGTRILEECMLAARKKMQPLKLRVLRANRARLLYERLGFVRTFQSATHYFMEWRPQTANSAC